LRSLGSLGLSPVIWRDVDAAVADGAVVWSGTCTGPLPGPDGGYCAWEWLDGSAQWAPCPPDGGTLCPGYEADGDAIPVACPPPGAAGGFSNGNGGASGDLDDGGATVRPAETPAATAGGGCAVSSGEGGATYAGLAAFAALSLAIRIRGERRRRRARAGAASR
jgi:hypothetical protein